MVVERAVLFGVQNLQQSCRRIATIIGTHFVDLIEQEERIGALCLFHRLNDAAGHRTNISAAMSANFRLIAHATQRHAHKVAPGCFGDGLTQRGFTHAWRPYEAQDRAPQLIGAGTNGQILQDALFDFFQAIVIAVEHLFSRINVFLGLLLLAPRQSEQPIEIIAHDGRFCRHRAHLLQFFEFGFGLGAGFFGEFGFADLLFQLLKLIPTFVLLAQLALNGLHLLIQIIVALALLHLPLHAVTDAALNLQHAHFAFHEGEDALETLGRAEDFQQFLLLFQLDRQIVCDHVSHLASRWQLAKARDDFRRDFAVEFYIILKLLNRCTRQCLCLWAIGIDVFDFGDLDREHRLGRIKALNRHARLAFNKNFYRPVGQF